MTTLRALPRADRDRGFSLVEVVVTMFLIALMAVGILPLILGLTQSSVGNKTLLAATALANGELAKLQASFPTDPSVSSTSCLALRSLQTVAPAAPSSTDPANGLDAWVTVGTCPTTFPASVPVRVTVTQGTDTITTVHSRVRVAIA